MKFLQHPFKFKDRDLRIRNSIEYFCLRLMTYLFTGIKQTTQNIIQNVERHGDCVAFVDPLQPHTGS